jgi:citrate/tricarballylate utilization protein
MQRDSPRSPLPPVLLQKAEQEMRICNACRYCEGFCAVFPAIERRLTFASLDLEYLAHLCHDCRECYYSCQYAPPHEFGVHLPRTFAAIRRESYRTAIWPQLMTALATGDRLRLVLGAVVAPAVVMLLLGALVDASRLFAAHPDSAGGFYQVIPHGVMVNAFGALGLLAAAALVAALVRFWHASGEPHRAGLVARAIGTAVRDTMTLRYLEGGGGGCAYPDEAPSRARRWFHHLTFYGFGLCFAATTTAAFYHNVLGWRAPYDLLSAPVVLGSVGGAGLLVGPAGLAWLKIVRDPRTRDTSQENMDLVFLVMLFLTSLSGFALLVLRESSAMGIALGLHLGFVAGLFVVLPYGKFLHAPFRFAALVRNAIEQRRVEAEHAERF